MLGLLFCIKRKVLMKASLCPYFLKSAVKSRILQTLWTTVEYFWNPVYFRR